MLAAVFAVALKPHARENDKICEEAHMHAVHARAHTNARIVFQMIGCDVIQANLFSEKDSSDYGQSPGLPATLHWPHHMVGS